MYMNFLKKLYYVPGSITERNIFMIIDVHEKGIQNIFQLVRI